MKTKIVVGFESQNRIERFTVHSVVDGVAVGTLGADPDVVRLRPVPVRNPDFEYRMLVAAGSDQFNAVEFA